jgi:ribosomal-protein-alanine N-acetyltransferase
VVARPATAADAEPIAELLMRGFETYTEWAPEWSPTEELREEQRRAWHEGLTQPEPWTVVAEAEGGVIAVARFGPARTDRTGGDRIAGMAHFGALFVDPRWWGSGVAQMLLSDAIREMRKRGYESVRLLVPEGNERARRLYARHGFEPLGPWSEKLFGLEVVELRLRL